MHWLILGKWGIFQNISPFLIYPKTVTMLVSWQQSNNFLIGNTLVIKSDQFCLCKSFFSRTSYIQWYRISMCFEREWKVEFFAKWIGLCLSHNIMYLSWFTPSSRKKFFIHNISLHASVAVMYSNSVAAIRKHTFVALIARKQLPLQT